MVMAAWGVLCLAVMCVILGMALNQASAEIEDLDRNMAILEDECDRIEMENRKLEKQVQLMKIREQKQEAIQCAE